MEPHPTGNPLERWGANAADARTALGLPAAEVARTVDVTPKHLWAIESGKAKPSYALQVALAGVYGKSVTELFPRTDDEAGLVEAAARCTSHGAQ